MKLKNFVMVMFSKDTMVDPKESEVRYSTVNTKAFMLFSNAGIL